MSLENELKELIIKDLKLVDITPEDIKAIGPDVLRHRIVLTYEAEAEELVSDDIVQRVFDAVEVP